MPGVVVIGAGQAGVEVSASLRKHGFDGEIVLASDERSLPYRRPPLSKEILLGTSSEDSVSQRAPSFFADKQIDLRRGDAIRSIDRARRRVQFASGAHAVYEHLVISTGSRPRPLPVPGVELDGVMTLHTIEDALSLKARLVSARSLVVVGGGFIGLEVAAAGCTTGVEVTVLEAFDRTMARAVSPEMSAYMTERHIQAGVDVRLGVRVVAIADDGSGRVAGVALEGGEVVKADVVVVGVGAIANTEIAVQAGLPAPDGIVVNEHLKTQDARIFAIGDCCSFPWHGTQVRLESVQNATDQARCVAASITGTPTRYSTVPWFWSFQGTSRLQIAGLIRDYDTTVLHGDADRGSFSVFCFAANTLVGVESMNAPNDHVAARKLLALNVPISR